MSKILKTPVTEAQYKSQADAAAIAAEFAATRAEMAAADFNLQEAINAETAFRINEDTALEERLVVETAERVAAVANLQNQLDAEVANRGSDTAYLQTLINSETAFRIADFEELQSALNLETSSRVAAVADIQTKINAEATARTNADNALADRITTETAVLRAALDAETLNRTNDDTTLSNRIDAEAHSRAAECALLSNRIAAETSTRAAAISDLQVQLSSEKVNRNAAISNLQTQISDEVSNRQSAFTALTNRINAETSTRAASVTSLQAQISNEVENRTQAISDMHAAIMVSLGDNKALEQIENEKLRNQIASETAAQAATVSQLNTRLTNEVQALQNANSQLQTQLQNAINAETAARVADIAELNSKIATEKTNRQNADTQLQNNINVENQTRAAAVTSLQNQIDAEKTNRANAINDMQAAILVSLGNEAQLQNIENENLRSQIASETAAQTAALAQVNSRIDSEVQARQNGDAETYNRAKIYIDEQVAYILENYETVTKLTKPTAPVRSYTYDGTAKTLGINNFDSNTMNISGTRSAVNAGSYTVTISLKDTASTQWADGTTSDISFTWTVAKAKLSAANSTFSQKTVPTFTGSAISISATYINGYAEGQIWSSQTSATNAGTYTAKVVPDSNHTWNDGTTSQKSVSWQIARAQIATPSLDESTPLTYDGTAKTPALLNFNSAALTKSGDISKTAAGNYTIYLTPDSNHCWGDSTYSAKGVNWAVARAKIATPYVDSSVTLTYNGRAQSPTLVNFNENTATKSGDISAVNAGTYTLYITPDSNHCWNDSTFGAVTLSYTINKALLPDVYWDPSVDVRRYPGDIIILYYTGNEIKVTDYVPLVNFNSDTMTVNNLTATKANNGLYCDVRPKDSNNAEFASGAEYCRCIWIVESRAVYIRTNAVTAFNFDGTQKTVDISLHKSGTITPLNNSAGDTDRFLTITGTQSATAAGNYSFTVSVNDNSCYLVNQAGDRLGTSYVVNWSIGANGIDEPSLSDTFFEYDGQQKTPFIFGFDSDTMVATGDLSKTERGIYQITVALKDKEHSCWKNNGTNDLVFGWTLGITLVDKPVLTNPTENYTSFVRYYYFDFDGFDTATMVVSSKSDAVADRGSNRYALDKDYITANSSRTGWLRISLRDSTTTRWSDLTSASVRYDKSVNLINSGIEQAAYAGQTFTYSYTGNNTMPPDGNGALGFKRVDGSYYQCYDVGTYEITVTPNLFYCWADGTRNTVTCTLVISAAAVPFPDVTNTASNYDGNSHAPTVANVSNFVTVSGDTDSKVQAGTYAINFNLNCNSSKINATWADGTTDTYVVNWSIGTGFVAIPSLYPSIVENTGVIGQQFSTSIVDLDSNAVTVSGSTTFTFPTFSNAADLQAYIQNVKENITHSANLNENYPIPVTFSLKNPASQKWADGTTSDKIKTWYVGGKTISLEDIGITEGEGVTYNGNAHTADEVYSNLLSYANSRYFYLFENPSKTNAGRYPVSIFFAPGITLQGNTGVLEKYLYWTINKATPNITKSAVSVVLNKSSNTAVVSVSSNSPGAFSVDSSREQIAVATYDSATKKVTVTGVDTGRSFIHINQAESDNYAARTVAVTCDVKYPLENTGWAAMSLLSFDNSVENPLTNYFQIGDSKIFKFGNMNYKATLIGINHNGEKAANYKGNLHFMITDVNNLAAINLGSSALSNNINDRPAAYNNYISDSPDFSQIFDTGFAGTWVDKGLENWFINQFEAELRDALAAVPKYQYRAGNVEKIARKVFYLDPFEISGTTNYLTPTMALTGTNSSSYTAAAVNYYSNLAQYEYFANGNCFSHVRPVATRFNFSLPTNSEDVGQTVYIDNDGNPQTHHNTSVLGVVPCFAI